MLVASVVARAVVTKTTSLAGGVALLWQHPQVLAELAQLFEVLQSRVDHVHHPLTAYPAVPLQVHARYTRVEIQAAFGVGGTKAKVAAWQTGVRWLPNSKADLFAFTLDKTTGGFSPTTRYKDYAISKASNTGADDRFGALVAVWGDTVVVGAAGESSNATGVNGDQSDNSASGSGAVYAFLMTAPTRCMVTTNCTTVTLTTYCTKGTTAGGCRASISGTGTASGSAGSGFDIAVTGVDGKESGLIFYSISGRNALPWGVGTSYLCTKTPTQRTPINSSGGTNGMCDGQLTLDWNAFIASKPNALGNPFLGGEAVWAQFRDPGSAKNTSLSDALEFPVTP